MKLRGRPAPFVVTSANHGTMIVNRNDYRMVDANVGYGVGHDLLTYSSFDQDEIDLALTFLNKRRAHFGNGVVAVDCGANIGVHTVEWGRFMYGWGEVFSFEAQEKIFYALAGNIVLNNCLNVTARHAAVGANCGTLGVPEPNYLVPSSFGSLELRRGDGNEFIGQPIDYTKTKPVALISLDSLGLKRLDFIKIDVEGMEVDVLAGASQSVEKFRPIILLEITKSDGAQIDAFFARHGYKGYRLSKKSMFAVHAADPMDRDIRVENNTLKII